jgi:hypothetical protein
VDHLGTGDIPECKTPLGSGGTQPAPNAELSLATDAFNTHIGGVIQQKSRDHWRPLGFFSHKLTESRYSTFDCELLAAFAAIRHFCHFFKGWSFQLWTDHKPLVTALSHVSDPILPRQQRHLAFISEFNVQMLYLPGLKNIVADFLSRPSPPPPESAETVAASVAADPVNSMLWSPSKTAAHKRSTCFVVHPPNLPFAKQALNTSLVMSQQAVFAPLSHKNSEKTIFFSFPQHFTSWEAHLSAYGIF